MITQENIPYTIDEIKAMVKTCEKYNKVRDMAKKIYNTEVKPDEAAVLAKYLPMLFPELKKSKDERIRRVIRGWIYTRPTSFFDNGISKEEILAWLEKQGQKEATWNKEDEENMNNVLYILHQLKDTSSYEEDNIGENTINWFKSLKDRLCPNNEYDKDMLGAIEYCKKNNRPLEKEHLAWLEKQNKQSYSNIPSRETILAIWELGNDWKELTNGSISTEYGTQLEYIQKHWQESSYYDNIGDNIPTLTDKDYDKLFVNCKHEKIEK